MRKLRFAIRSDQSAVLQFGTPFVVVGAMVGLLRGDGILVGAVIGLLFYGAAIGIEQFATSIFLALTSAKAQNRVRTIRKR